jgi:hypothetical protein
MTKKMLQREVNTLQNDGSVLGLVNELTELANQYGIENLEYEIANVGHWDDKIIEFTIYLQREETDQEYEERLIREDVRARLEEEREKKEFERLMLKFKKPSV